MSGIGNNANAPSSQTNPGNFANRPHEEVVEIAGKGGCRGIRQTKNDASSGGAVDEESHDDEQGYEDVAAASQNQGQGAADTSEAAMPQRPPQQTSQDKSGSMRVSEITLQIAEDTKQNGKPFVRSSE